jgi:hypothetical protein
LSLNAAVVAVSFVVILPQVIKLAHLLQLDLLCGFNLNVELVKVVFYYFAVSVSFFKIVGDLLHLLVAVIYCGIIVVHLLE